MEITIHKKNEIIRGKPFNESLSLDAKRCLNSVYYIVQKSINNKEENKERIFTISFQEFKKLMGIKDNNYIYIIRDSIKELQKPFQLYNYKTSASEKVLWHSTVFISDFKIIEKNKEKIVQFELNRTIYDLIKETGNFTELEFKTIQTFKTKYSSILYEYLKSYSNLEKIELSLEAINGLLVTEFNYLADIKKIINRSLKEFQKTDLLNLTFETDKNKKIIVFYFNQKDKEIEKERKMKELSKLKSYKNKSNNEDVDFDALVSKIKNK